jgi:hypothetical protein
MFHKSALAVSPSPHLFVLERAMYKLRDTWIKFHSFDPLQGLSSVLALQPKKHRSLPAQGTTMAFPSRHRVQSCPVMSSSFRFAFVLIRTTAEKKTK